MIMSKKKIVRVEMEYEGGEVQYLEGKDAEDWLEKVDGQIMIASVHGFGFPAPFPWKTKTPRKPLTNSEIWDEIGHS
jgi:hypothetical protein